MENKFKSIKSVSWLAGSLCLLSVNNMWAEQPQTPTPPPTITAIIMENDQQIVVSFDKPIGEATLHLQNQSTGVTETYQLNTDWQQQIVLPATQEDEYLLQVETENHTEQVDVEETEF